PRRALGEIEHARRTGHVDAHAQLARRGQVVHRGEVIDLAHVRGIHLIERESQIAFDEMNAIGQRRMLCLDLPRTLFGQRSELRLHETECDLIRSRQYARQQLRPEETGEAGEENARHPRSMHTTATVTARPGMRPATRRRPTGYRPTSPRPANPSPRRPSGSRSATAPF